MTAQDERHKQNLEKTNASLEPKKQKRNIYWGETMHGLRPEGREAVARCQEMRKSGVG